MFFHTSDYMYVCEVREGRFLIAAHGFNTESYWETNATARFASASELAEAKLQPNRDANDVNHHPFFSIGKEHRIVCILRDRDVRWVTLR